MQLNDIFIRLVSLPRGINGMTILDAEGNYNVYINQELPREPMIKAYKHEIQHIKDDDFYNSKSVRDAEELR